MSKQRYEPVATIDQDDHVEHSNSSHASPHSPSNPNPTYPIPSSPPPSFRSRASSPSSRRHLLLADDPIASHEDQSRTLADAFDAEDSNSDDDEEADGRQRLMRAQPERIEERAEAARPGMQRQVTQLPVFTPAPVTAVGPGGRVYGGGRDAVFANMSAKPGTSEEADEKPPSYEQAAADATPPYWETTILAPGMSSTDVFIDGLPVGSIFSFVWNAMISVSFQFVGFLLTYLLHTTHAAKNGSRAGLGITLINIGFGMKGATGFLDGGSSSPPPAPGSGDPAAVPEDPNAHDFDANAVSSSAQVAVEGFSTSEWFAYILMIVGWFILIRSISDYLRARRHEQLVLQSPDRGLPVPIIAEGESPERSV